MLYVSGACCLHLSNTDFIKGCGNELGAQTVQAADNNCQMACNGDHTQFCGGSNRLTLYHFEEPVVEDPEDPEVPV